MSDKEMLWGLIVSFLNNKCDIGTFCDKFTQKFNFDTKYSTLSPQEEKAFGDLCDIADRYWPDPNVVKIPNVYFSEAQIREKAQEIYDGLGDKLK